MASVHIRSDIFAVGVLNPNLRVFDIVMETAFGTSYNAYLIDGEKKVLIETCHEPFFEQFLDKLKARIDPAELDYIILNHCEPDHSGALVKLCEHCPKAQILASPPGALYLKQITNRPDLPIRAVKDGERLDIGGGRELQFMLAPFLHWPDSMFTWLEAEKTLFTCDFLGAHFCEPGMFDYNIIYDRNYERELKGYYDAIFSPFTPHVRNGLDKVEACAPEVVCPSHGPILTRGSWLEEVIDRYRRWSAPRPLGPTQIPIFYSGIKEVLPGAAVCCYDIIDHDMADLQGKLNTSDAFLLGSPTINRDAVPPLWELLSHIDAVGCQKKPCAVFGSFGWSGEAVPALCARLTTLKCALFDTGFKVQFIPSEQQRADGVAYGRGFAEHLKQGGGQ